MPDREVRPFLWDARRRAPQATYPRMVTPRARALRLFGLAAGGVCLATGVTTRAVRSYRTISPLPEEMQSPEALRVQPRSHEGLTKASRRIQFLFLRAFVAAFDSAFCISPGGFFLLHFPSDCSASPLATTGAQPVFRLGSSDFPRSVTRTRPPLRPRHLYYTLHGPDC